MKSFFLFTILLVSLCSPVSALEMKLYTPESDVRVDVKAVRLLAAQDVFSANIPNAVFSAFIENAKKSVIGCVQEDSPAFELLVQFTLTSGAKPKFELSSHGNPPKILLQAIYESLQKLPDTRSTKDPLPFQIHFVIKARQ